MLVKSFEQKFVQPVVLKMRKGRESWMNQERANGP